MNILEVLANQARQFAQSQANPQLPGPLNNIPAPLKPVVTAMPGVGALTSPGFQMAKPLYENVGGKAVSGELLLLEALPAALFGDPNNPQTQAARELLQQGPLHPIRVQEMAERNPHSIISMGAGAQQMLWDPINFVAPAAGLLKGTKLAQLGRIVEAVDRAQGAPMEALGQVGNRAVRGIMQTLADQRAAREVAQEAEAVAKRAELPLPLAPSSGNLRGYLRELGLPAPQAVKQEPSSLAPRDFSIIRAAKQYEPSAPPEYPNVRNFVPREAVTEAEERAAKEAVYGPARRLLEDVTPEATPDLVPEVFPTLTGTRQELLAGLSRSDLARLVSTAYGDVPRAIGNAQKKYTEGTALAERAIERITQNPKLAARLQQRAPDLAEWVAELPERLADEAVDVVQGATPPPINAVGESIDEIVARNTPEPPAFYEPVSPVSPRMPRKSREEIMAELARERESGDYRRILRGEVPEAQPVSAIAEEVAPAVVEQNPLVAQIAALEERLRGLGTRGNLNAVDATKQHIRLLRDRLDNPRAPHTVADLIREDELRKEVGRFEGFLSTGRNALNEPIGPEYREYWTDYLGGLRGELDELQAIDRPASMYGLLDIKKVGKGYQVVHAATDTPLGDIFAKKRQAEDALFNIQTAYRDSDEVRRLLGYRASDPTSAAAQQAVRDILAPKPGMIDTAAGGGMGILPEATPPGQKPTWAMTFRERMKAALGTSPYDTPEEAAARLQAIDTHADRVAAFEGLVNAGDKGALGAIPNSKAQPSSRYEALYPEQYYASKYSGIVSSVAANLYDDQRRVVQAALEAGEDVPPEVLADFPMLQGIVRKPPAQGGDIAAGGGFGILPVPGGLAGLERTLTGAAAGGVAGTVGGALAPADSTEERARNIAIGATTGLVGGGSVGAAAPQLRQFAQTAAREVIADPATWSKRLEGRLLADPEILADTLTAVRRARDEAGVTKGPRNFSEIWRAFVAQWKRQEVDTWKQFGQDALYRATVNEGIARNEFGIGEQTARQFQRAVSRERATGAWSLDDPLNQLYIQIGHPEAIGLKRDIIGTDFIDAVTDVADKGVSRFGRVGSAVAGGLIGMGSALKSVNPISPIAGAIRGAADLEISTMLHHLISTANDGWREAMAHAGTSQRIAADGEAFLAQLAAKGIDVTPLQGRAGLFSADEVRTIAGKEAGDAWDELTTKAIREVGDRVAFLAGDFRDKLDPGYVKRGGTVTQTDRLLGGAEKAASKVAPFARWQIRSTPVLLEVAARHPLAAYHVVTEMQRLGEEAKAEGKRAYQAGYDISTETTLLGAVARARLGGKQGTWTVDPYGAVVPYGEAIAGGDGENPDAQTAYQRVSEVLNRIGLGPSPLIQAGAYVTGQDYRAPGSLSRTAGLEQLGNLLPVVGDIDLPTGRGLLDAARGVIEPAVADQGIKTTGKASATDPVLRRYAELVFDRTGKPLADKANTGYLDGNTPEAQALMQQAEREEALQAAAGNVVSLTNPVPSTAQSADSAAANKARKPVIEAQNMVDKLPPVQGAMLQQQIDQYKVAHPESRVYEGANPYQRAQLLMADWERQNALLSMFPEIYEYQRQIYAEEIGLVDKGTLARKQRAIDEAGLPTAVPGVANRLQVDPGAAYRLRRYNAVR